jgi:hypothetical protein
MHAQALEPCTITIFAKPAESALLARIRGEFREMPGMRVTPAQARRLWSLDPAACTAALESLMGSGFLTRDASGRYMKTHGGY